MPRPPSQPPRTGYEHLRPGKNPAPPDPNLVRIKNTTASDVIGGGVLGITGVLNTIAGSSLKLYRLRQVFLGVSPSTASHSGRFAVPVKNIKAGETGLATLTGLCMVQVSIANVADRYADVKNGDATQLLSGSFGSAQIIDSPGSTGTQWCLVRLENGCS